MAKFISGIFGACVAAGLLFVPLAASAQDLSNDARLRKVEAEVRALQRKVFPGADGRYFEPQIGPADQAAPASTSITAPTTTAVTDILARLDALEAQLQRLTARGEENSNALSQLGTRVDALEAAGAQVPADPAQNQVSAADANLAAMTGGASQKQVQQAAPAPKPAAPSDARLAAVREIAKPQTEDPGADEYSYGFRLWNAGFYPEARQQLDIYLQKYPQHSQVSYGRNLMGRAFLDDGQAEEAARWFLRNYQADKQGARAGDSLLFLAETMAKLSDTKRACIALAEFGETYPALATGRLQQQYDASRQKVKCN